MSKELDIQETYKVFGMSFDTKEEAIFAQDFIKDLPKLINLSIDTFIANFKQSIHEVYVEGNIDYLMHMRNHNTGIVVNMPIRRNLEVLNIIIKACEPTIYREKNRIDFINNIFYDTVATLPPDMSNIHGATIGDVEYLKTSVHGHNLCYLSIHVTSFEIDTNDEDFSFKKLDEYIQPSYWDLDNVLNLIHHGIKINWKKVISTIYRKR